MPTPLDRFLEQLRRLAIVPEAELRGLRGKEVSVDAVADAIVARGMLTRFQAHALVSGEEAAEWGLANEAHPEGELQPAIQRTVDHLLKLSPAALAVAKKAFYAWDSMHLDKGLARAEKIYLDELMQTEDVKEGIAAWMEKRKPVWKGK